MYKFGHHQAMIEIKNLARLIDPAKYTPEEVKAIIIRHTEEGAMNSLNHALDLAKEATTS